MRSLSFSRFVNESYIRREVYSIWNLFTELDDELNLMHSEKADDFLYKTLSSLKLRVSSPLSLYKRFKSLKNKYDSGSMEWDEALALFKDSVDILMFESLDKKI